MVDVERTVETSARLTWAGIAVKLEAPMLPANRAAERLRDGKFHPPLHVFRGDEPALGHEHKRGRGVVAGLLVEQAREFSIDLIEEEEDLNHIRGRDVWLVEGKDLAILEGDLEVFLARRDEKRAGFPAEREHLEGGL